jgi:hypothetical protein
VQNRKTGIIGLSAPGRVGGRVFRFLPAGVSIRTNSGFDGGLSQKHADDADCKDLRRKGKRETSGTAMPEWTKSGEPPFNRLTGKTMCLWDETLYDGHTANLLPLMVRRLLFT